MVFLAFGMRRQRGGVLCSREYQLFCPRAENGWIRAEMSSACMPIYRQCLLALVPEERHGLGRKRM